MVHEPGILFYLLCTGIFVCGGGMEGNEGLRVSIYEGAEG